MTTHYIIYERPVGSDVWTQVMNEALVPFRTSSEEKANARAIEVCEKRNTCTIVVPVHLPSERDTSIWARLQGGVDWFKAEEP